MGVRRQHVWRRLGITALAGLTTLSTVLALSATAKPAVTKPERRTLDHVIDSRGGGAIAPGRATDRARVALARHLGSQGVVIDDPLTGTLRMVGRLDGFLTSRSARPAAQVAMSYLRTHLVAFALTRADLRTFDLRGDYVDILGTHHLSWTQSSHGVTVFQNGLKANVTNDGRLINLTGSPVHGLRSSTAIPGIAASDAIGAARRSAEAPIAAPQRGDRASLALFATGRDARLAWRTETRIADDETDLTIVDAQTGAVLWRANMTHNDVAGSGNAWEYSPGSNVPNGGGVLHPVSFPVSDGTALSGNNAHVFNDTMDDNAAQPKDEIPATSGLTWDYTPTFFDTTNTAQNCSTTNPCSWDKGVPFSWQENANFFGVQYYHLVNMFHDYLLAPPIGFTEAAGNFQVTNASGQGLGGDAVQAHSLDGAATANGLPDGGHVNNANMTTFEDGVAPVMQMYLNRKAPYGPSWGSTHSGDEAGSVWHEYTHGLSGRLVTYPDGIPAVDSAQAGAMGEAWSDWYAADLGANDGFLVDGPAQGDVDIFRYTDGNTITFRIEAMDCPIGSQAANCAGTPGSGSGGFDYGDFGKILGSPEVHADGEIWGQTLWEMRQQLGSTVMETVVTRGMELSPPEPSFLDMRNAILQADMVAYNGVHADALWSIFAERGMGYFAAAVDGSDGTPVADFSLPVDCSSVPCGTVSGTITDTISGLPLASITVGIAGHSSGLPGDLADITDSSGNFSISGVPFHTYPKFFVDKTGYEQVTIENLVVDGDVTVNRSLVRDWASLEGGAKIVKASPPDYSGYGCGPSGAFDLSLASGWSTDAAGPRSIVVRLPEATDITSFGFSPGNTCGDSRDAAAKTFAIYTKKAGDHWVLAYEGNKKLPIGKLTRLVPIRGTDGVRFVKLVLLTNRGNDRYMDMLELTVRGT